MNTIYTIGHSTRPIYEFIDLLNLYSINQLVDVRTIPKSRHNPQFGQDNLKRSLKSASIDYVHLEKLGGLRPASKNSVSDAWHNASFRNYADYMQTTDFAEGIDELIDLATDKVTAIMCAEALPWRCHRSLISDALLARHQPVCEIISVNNIREHSFTSFAVVNGTSVTYPKSALKE